jgi:hypothetical protein
MRGINQLLLTSAAGILIFLTASPVMGQNNQGGGRQRQGNGQGGGRQRQGNADPAQFQQRMLERYKERLEVTEDAEWKVMQPLIQKVLDARIAIGAGGRGAVGRGGRPGGNGTQAGRGQGPNPASVNPAAEALRKAIETKAPSAEVKPLLAGYLQYRKGKQADLEKAQEALRAVLTSRQEAIAVLAGLL